MMMKEFGMSGVEKVEGDGESVHRPLRYYSLFDGCGWAA